MESFNFNWFGLITATLSGFVIGGLWYSPILFGKAWSKLAGLSDSELNESNKPKIFGFSFIFLAIAAVNLVFFLSGDGINLGTGAFYGFLTGFGWAAMAIGVTGLFELKPWKLILINGGYWVVTLTIMGLIIGATNPA